MNIRIGILGYGNLGRGVECAIKQNDDMELVAVFTRRNPKDLAILTEGVEVCSINDIKEWKDKIDAKAGGNVAIISSGWDPGMFSLNRLYASAVLPNGSDYTFWGRGVSQGHSDAIRRIKGVKDARQYTVPVESATKACSILANSPFLSTKFVLFATEIKVPAVSKKSTNNNENNATIQSGWENNSSKPFIKIPKPLVSKSTETIAEGTSGIPSIPNKPKTIPTIAVITKP